MYGESAARQPHLTLLLGISARSPLPDSTAGQTSLVECRGRQAQACLETLETQVQRVRVFGGLRRRRSLGAVGRVQRASGAAGASLQPRRGCGYAACKAAERPGRHILRRVQALQHSTPVGSLPGYLQQHGSAPATEPQLLSIYISPCSAPMKLRTLPSTETKPATPGGA